MSAVETSNTDRSTVVGHLAELRTRLIVSILAIACTTILAYIFSDQLLKLLLLPAGSMKLNAFNIMDGFFIRWRIALFTGIILAFPVWAFQLYRFVAPALRPNERKVAGPLLSSALALFVAGTAFGYYLLWGMIRFFVRLFPPEIQYLPATDNYLSFVTFFMLACGLAFLFPAVLLALIRLRLLTTTLLRKQRKIGYFALFVLAEVITPVADPIVAPLTVMLPLILLYEGTILVGKRIERTTATPPALTRETNNF